VSFTGSLSFAIDARHVRQLGQELVADAVTAVAELIKNAYDADATHIIVVFSDVGSQKGGTLEVRDNGSGMTLADVRDKWMRISTDNKERDSVSPRFGRSRAGHKGIGRFAVETLGERLVLQSIAQGSSERITVIFDWDAEYSAGTELSAIANPFVVEPCSDESMVGTLLRIEGLHSVWSDNAIRRVRRAVLLLQPPFPIVRVMESHLLPGQYEPDPGFAVEITREGQSEALDDANFEEFFAASTAIIHGHVDENGLGVWYTKSEQLELDDRYVVPSPVLTSGPFHFESRYFIYSRDIIGSRMVSLARQMGSQYGGIRLYRNGFRILPYGDRGNDWLRLDLEARQRTTLVPVSNNNFFGQVFISREHNLLLVDTASREGVIENEAFEELRAFVQRGLIWGARRVGSARQRKVQAGPRRPPTRAQLVSRAVEAVQAAVTTTDSAVDEDLRRELAVVLGEAREADREESLLLTEMLGEAELLRILASLGTSIAVFSHEVRGTLNSTKGALMDVFNIVSQMDGSGIFEATNRITEAQTSVGRLDELSGFIETHVSHSRRRSREPQPMQEVLRQFTASFLRTLNRRGVEIEYRVEPQFLRTAPMARSEIDAMLFNFLTNSLKAMDHEGHERRRIAVVVHEDRGMIVLRFQDTGSGIDKSIRERIFNAFITSSRPGDDVLGIGTGLGLKIVWDIANTNGGSVQLGAPDGGYNTSIELRLPKWVPDKDGGGARDDG